MLKAILFLVLLIPSICFSQEKPNGCGCPSNTANVAYVCGDTLCLADCPVGREILSLWLKDTAYRSCPFVVGNVTYGTCWKTSCKRAGYPSMLLMVDSIFIRPRKTEPIVKEPIANKEPSIEKNISTAQQ